MRNLSFLTEMLPYNTFCEVESIIAALNENTTLRLLDLHSSTGVSTEALEQIDILCNRNQATSTGELPATKIACEYAI